MIAEKPQNYSSLGRQLHVRDQRERHLDGLKAIGS